MYQTSQITKDNIGKVIVAVIMALLIVRCHSGPFHTGVLHIINFPIHKFGHIIFSPFGKFIEILGGPILQILVPAALAISLFLFDKKFCATLALMWLGDSILDVSAYAKDAISMQLPLENSIHDWNYILTTTNTLNDTDSIAQAIAFIGIIAAVSGIAGSFYVAINPTHRDYIDEFLNIKK